MNAHKIKKKLSECDPAGDLLLFSGFHLSNDKTRLIWLHTDLNMMIMKYVYNALNSMINPMSTMNNSQTQQQTQLIFRQMKQNAMKSNDKTDSKIINKNVSPRNPTNNNPETQQNLTQMISNLIMNQHTSQQDSV